MTDPQLTALVKKAQAGSKEAMNDLITACYEDLFYYALKSVQDEDLAADITQEGCLDIVTKLTELREPGAFPVWARRILHTRCSRHFRSVREVTVEEDENGETIFDRLPDESDDALPEKIQEDREFRQTMQEMLDRLPPEQRTALLLYYYEKLSVEQIAQIQDVPTGTVKSRLNYGRKAVKAQVEDYERKTGVRLHSLAPLPLLLLFLLRTDRDAAIAGSAPLLGSILGASTAATASAATVTAATGAAVATTTSTTAGVAAASTGIAAKVGAALAAVAVTAGAVGVAIGLGDQPEQKERMTTDPTQTCITEQLCDTTASAAPTTEPLTFESDIVGEWFSLTGNGRSVVFHEDKTMELDGVTYRYEKELDCDYDEDDDTYEIDTNYYLYDENGDRGPYYFHLVNYEGAYCLNMHELDDFPEFSIYKYGFSVDIFYCPEQLSDYEAVVLTNENYRDYIQFNHKVYCDTENEVKYSGKAIVAEFSLTFSDDVAPISFCCGQLPKHARYYAASYDMSTGTYELLEPNDAEEPTAYWGGYFSFHAVGCASYTSWMNFQDQPQKVTGYLCMYTPQEAYDVCGVVFIPKK